MSLRFGAKIPGPVMRMGAVEMNFDYVDYFGSTPSTGYERLITLHDRRCDVVQRAIWSRQGGA